MFSSLREHCPKWFRPIIWTAYYTGMRRGEILGLTRKQVNLTKPIITLSPDDTKEAKYYVTFLMSSVNSCCIALPHVLCLLKESATLYGY